MTVLSLRNIPFYISGQYRAEVADTTVCTPGFAVLPRLFQARPIDSLNRTSYNVTVPFIYDVTYAKPLNIKHMR